MSVNLNATTKEEVAKNWAYINNMNPQDRASYLKWMKIDEENILRMEQHFIERGIGYQKPWWWENGIYMKPIE